MDNNSNKGDGRNSGQGQTILIILIAALITFISIFKMGDYLNGKRSTQEIPYSEFVRALEDGKVKVLRYTSGQGMTRMDTGRALSTFLSGWKAETS